MSRTILVEAGSFDLGNGAGFSLLDGVAAARAVTGRNVPCEIGPRREGNPAYAVGDARLAVERLGWQPRYPGLPRIMDPAWRWMQRAVRGWFPEIVQESGDPLA